MIKRTILSFLFVILIYNEIKSQIAFCPKGALWHTTFVYIPAFNHKLIYRNEAIWYAGDTLIGNDSVKILQHRYYYNSCDNAHSASYYKRTLIRQRGDTVFFSNPRTTNNWEILYNFGAGPGDSWTTTVLSAIGSPVSYTTTVDSITQVVENGLSMKRLHTTGGQITERYGLDGYLFNFSSNAPFCDGYFFDELLCYSDNELGTRHFSERPCNFSGTIDLLSSTRQEEDLSGIMIFPNPSGDAIKIIVNDPSAIDKLLIRNSLGQLVITADRVREENLIDLENLPHGLYYVELISAGQNHRFEIFKN